MKPIQAILHWMQDSELIAQLEKLEMSVHKFSLIVEALGEAEGIDVSSLTNETQDQLSGIPSPQSTSDMPLQVEEGDHDSDH
jgi:hypothetical protein